MAWSFGKAAAVLGLGLFGVAVFAAGAYRFGWLGGPSQDLTRCLNQDRRFTPDESIENCTAAIAGTESSKPQATALRGRAIAYEAKREYYSAIDDLNEAIRLDRSSAAAFANRGNAYRALGEVNSALADYSEALRLDPRLAVTLLARGDLYRAQGNLDRAIADYDGAIRLNPNEAANFNNRGLAYRQKGESDRAMADFEEAMRLNPRLAETFFNRGLSYAQKATTIRRSRITTKLSGCGPRSRPRFNIAAPHTGR